MKKLLMSVPAPLMTKIEKHIEAWGYPSKAEFFRHAALSYLERYEQMMATRKVGINLPFHAI